MTPKEYIEQCKQCMLIAQKNERYDLYDTYYGMYLGAKEVVRLVECGYSVSE